MRKAFTMLEMIFVIAIMSVISVMTFGMISQFYEAYIQKEAAGQLETETKVIIEQIANHLQNAIKDSIVVLDTTQATPCQSPLSTYSGTPAKIGLAWVGEDVDSKMGLWDGTKYTPGWSGYADIGAWSSGSTAISTPGSTLSNANTIISDLSGQANPLTTANFAALYFEGDSSVSGACNEFFTNGVSMVMRPITSTSGSTITLASAPTSVKEHYRLAWSAYAIVHNRNNQNELELVYNFRPWSGGTLASAISAGNVVLLGENISNIGFKYEGGLIRFNICMTKTINSYSATVCKEKVVF